MGENGSSGTRISTRLLVAVLCLIVVISAPASAGTQPESDRNQATDSITDAAAPAAENAGDSGQTGESEECAHALEQEAIQERSQAALWRWSCRTYRWFDGWWGEEEEFHEEEVNGLVTVGAEYRGYDGFDPKLRLRVRAPLPNLSRRWDLIIGRLNDDAFISDTEAQDNVFYNAGVIDRGDDEESWLLGLGNRRGRKRSGWTWGVGVRLNLPPDPYIKTRWHYTKTFSEGSDLRYRQTFFWRRDEGFGTTSRGDLAYTINPVNVLRWEGIATVSEQSEGLRWYVGQTWYHLVGERRAFSLLAFARGETDRVSGPRDIGFNFIWRQPFTRDWMYLSLGPSVTWPREKPGETREMSLGFGAWIEMEFGNWRY